MQVICCRVICCRMIFFIRILLECVLCTAAVHVRHLCQALLERKTTVMSIYIGHILYRENTFYTSFSCKTTVMSIYREHIFYIERTNSIYREDILYLLFLQSRPGAQYDRDAQENRQERNRRLRGSGGRRGRGSEGFKVVLELL